MALADLAPTPAAARAGYGPGMTPYPQQVDALVEAVSRCGPTALSVDSWAPSVQGAVGHVIGVRGGDGAPYVLKIYEPDGDRRAATEAAVLRLLQDQQPVPVPQVLVHGCTGGPIQRPYVIMTRIPGVRWADRRRGLRAQQSLELHRRVGQLLRRLHAVPAPWFGELLEHGPRHANAWEEVRARCDRLVDEHVRGGGRADTGHRVRRLVDRHRDAFESCGRAVLCHHDLIDSNLIVDADDEPRVRGVVDWERASWSDPIADLAQTKRHTHYHDPAASEVFVAAYGTLSDEDARRLLVHEVLHALDERTWINSDRPAGWQRSLAALDAFLMRST